MATSSHSQVSEEEFLGALYKGGELLAAGKIVEARSQLELANTLSPKNEKAQNLLGLAYFKLGLFDQASRIYEQLVNENPADPTLRVNLGLVYLKTNDLPRCIKEFETATDLDPNHKKAHNYLGLALAQAGNYAKARTHFVLAGSEQMADKMERALSAKSQASGVREVAKGKPQALSTPLPPSKEEEEPVELPPEQPERLEASAPTPAETPASTSTAAPPRAPEPPPSSPRLDNDWGAQFAVEDAPLDVEPLVAAPIDTLRPGPPVTNDVTPPEVASDEMPVIEAAVAAPSATRGKPWSTPLVNSWESAAGMSPPGRESPQLAAAPSPLPPPSEVMKVTSGEPMEDESWAAVKQASWGSEQVLPDAPPAEPLDEEWSAPTYGSPGPPTTPVIVQEETYLPTVGDGAREHSQVSSSGEIAPTQAESEAEQPEPVQSEEFSAYQGFGANDSPPTQSTVGSDSAYGGDAFEQPSGDSGYGSGTTEQYASGDSSYDAAGVQFTPAEAGFAANGTSPYPTSDSPYADGAGQPTNAYEADGAGHAAPSDSSYGMDPTGHASESDSSYGVDPTEYSSGSDSSYAVEATAQYTSSDSAYAVDGTAEYATAGSYGAAGDAHGMEVPSNANSSELWAQEQVAVNVPDYPQMQSSTLVELSVSHATGVEQLSGAFHMGAEGLAISVNGQVLSRMTNLVAIVGNVAAEPENKRTRGRQTEQPFGHGAEQVHRLTGHGVVHLETGGTRFHGLDLVEESAYLREERLFGFEESIGFEHGRLTEEAGKLGLDLVHLSGSGRVLLQLNGTLKSLAVPAGTPMVVPVQRLIGWFGHLTPRLTGFAGQGAVELTGEGHALLVAPG